MCLRKPRIIKFFLTAPMTETANCHCRHFTVVWPRQCLTVAGPTTQRSQLYSMVRPVDSRHRHTRLGQGSSPCTCENYHRIFFTLWIPISYAIHLSHEVLSLMLRLSFSHSVPSSLAPKVPSHTARGARLTHAATFSTP